MSNCIFCKIANHEIPGKILYEDNDCIAFLDLSQTTKGHTLVIPKAHAKSVLEIDQDNLAKAFKVAQNMANMLKTKLNANGVNIVTNSGVIAGQTIEHFHLHVIPRFDENDTFEINFTDNSQICDLDDVYKTIKN